MSRRKVPGVLITAVQTGWSEPSLTSRPSQRRKAKGAAIWPNTSRRTRAAPAGLGLGSAIIRIPPAFFLSGTGRPCQPLPGAKGCVTLASGTGSSCEPDEARGSQRREAYSLYVERRWRPSNEVWRRKLSLCSRLDVLQGGIEHVAQAVSEEVGAGRGDHDGEPGKGGD